MLNGLHNIPSANSSPLRDGMLLWYDAFDLNTFTFSTGNSLSQWRDKSGNGYHLQQTTGANQPSFSPGSLSGKPTVRFSSGLNLATAANVNYGVYTLFVIAKTDAATNSFLAGRTANSTGHDALSLRIAAYSISQGRGGEAARIFLSDYSGSYAVFSVAADGTVAGFIPYFNNVVIPTTNLSTGTPGVSNMSTPFLVGQQSFVGGLNGNIAEILLYNRVLSDSERLNVNIYLSKKWNLW